MGVIKGTIIPPAKGPHRPVFNFEDLTQHAQSLLDQVRSQSDDLLAEARRQAAVILAQAKDEAERCAARAADEARQTAEKTIDDRVRKLADERIASELRTLLPALRALVEGVAYARGAWQTRWEAQAVKLAAAVAARLVRRELTHDPQVPLALVREALPLAAGSPTLRLRLNPRDAEALSGSAQQLIAALAPVAKAEVCPDPAIEPGGCVLETAYGAIDQQFQSQLNRIVEELT
jgi:flagellar assembly protein FliH